jgi:hypothetical protein
MSDPTVPASPDVPVPPTPEAHAPVAPEAYVPTVPAPHAGPEATAPPAYGAVPPAYSTYPASTAPAPPRPKTLAVIALVLAGIGLVMAFIPIVTWFAGAALLAAFIIGLVALVNKKQGGKGFAIGAVVVSVVGWIVSIIVTIASFGMIGQAAIEESQRDEVASDSAPAEDEPAAEEAPADTRQELTLVETAFGQSSYDSSTWWYVAVVDNPNEDYIFSFAGIDVEALDANGTILDSSSDYRTILAGRTAVVGTFFSVGDGQITELNVRGPAATDATRAPSSTTGGFQIADVLPTTDDYSTNVHGNVTSTFAEDQELVQVVVIARNGAGAIGAAESGYIDRLPSGGTAQFEVRFFDPLPGDTTYEAYAVL